MEEGINHHFQSPMPMFETETNIHMEGTEALKPPLISTTAWRMLHQNRFIAISVKMLESVLL